MERGLTFSDVAELYLADASRKNDKPSVVDAKRTIVYRHVLPILNDVEPHRATPFHVDEVLERLEGLAPSTINNVVTVLRGLLLTAKRRGMAVPELYLPRVAVPEKEMKWLDAIQLAQLIDGAGKVSPECVAMVLLGAKAGLRRGEMVGLKWEDVSLDARRLTVRRSTYGTIETAPKSGRFRVVPICAQLGEALAQLARPTAYVLTRTLQNTGCTKERKVPNLKASTGTVHRWMQLACEAAGLTGFGVHSLRHTFCSHLAQRGVSLLLIQRLAGHSDHKITQRYAHFAEQQLMDAVGVL